MRLTLKKKFSIGLGMVCLVAVLMLVGVRMLSKTARLHYLEREHLAIVLEMQDQLTTVMRDGASAGVQRTKFLSALDKARSLAGSLPVEMFSVEIAAFRLFGFTPLINLPGESLQNLDRVRSVITSSDGLLITLEDARRSLPDIQASHAAGDRFGPLLEEATSFVKHLVLWLNLCGIATILLVFVMIRRATLPHLDKARRAAQRIAEGDLSGPRLVAEDDEMGQLNVAINEMKACLVKVVGEVRDHSITVAESMAEVASGSEDLSHRTERQASTLQETASNMSSMRQTLNEIGQQVRSVEHQSSQARIGAVDGGKAVAAMVSRMEEILSSSRRIAAITDVVNGIAFQTNVLALNAAVEAARAGEQGRGFAVVASEVRSLASRSANAAKEISGLIEDITGIVQRGATEASATGHLINEVIEEVSGVSNVVTTVAQKLSAQESNFAQLDHAMCELDSGTQQNAAMSEQAASAAAAMRAQANQLVEAVGRFTLDKA